MDVLRVINSISSVMRDTWGSEWGSFGHDFPVNQDLTTVRMPLITYRIASIEPAELGSERQIKPRQMAAVGDIVPFLQVFDYTLLFTVWHRNYEALFSRVDEFMSFLLAYQHKWLEAGADYLCFSEGHESDVVRQQTRIELVGFDLVYELRMKRTIEVAFPKAFSLTVETLLNPDGL